MSTDLDTLALQHANGLGPAALLARWQQAADRKAPAATEPSPEQIAYAQAYWQRVWAAPEPPAPDILCTRAARIEMPYAEARRQVWTLLDARARAISGRPAAEFWQFDAYHADIIRSLIRYFTNDPDGPYPPHKGLFLFGPPGTGKTELMQIMSAFASRAGLTKAFQFSSMSDIYTRARTTDDYDPIAPNIQFHRCFDELVRYTGAVHRFGNPIDLNEAIIEQRYARWQRYGQITHFIANATPTDTKTMFTEMLFDRLRALCTSVEFRGASKR